MYSSGYSQVNKFSPQAQRKMHRSKGKSCGYYMRIVFFFSSLIQSLIIVSLVLFLLYGKKQDSASTARIQDLEGSFSHLSIENVALRQQRKNLTNFLNVTLTEKARNDWDLDRCRKLINISIVIIQDFEKKLVQCNRELYYFKVNPQCPSDCSIRPPINCNCGMLYEQLKAKLQLVESNFTQTTQRIRMEMDQIAKERDHITLEAIQLRRDKSIQEKELQFYRNKAKDDFSQSLSGVSNVSKAFLSKIDSLFPTHIAFQLTCAKQQEHLDQIRTNCTNLSREVEDKLQRYLNSVGNQVSDIQAENNRLKAENWRFSEDYRWCSHNRSELIKEHRQNLQKLQGKHDKEKEKLLLDKLKLNGDIEVLENSVNVKSKEVDYCKEQLKQLNMSCMSKPGFGISTSRGSSSTQSGWNSYSAGGSSSSGGGGQLGRTGSVGLGSSLGSSGSVYNKPVSPGTGSSSSSSLSPGSSPNLSSAGSVYNKPASPGTGSSSSSSLSPGSSPNLSSAGSMYNKPASPGTGSSSSSSSSLGSSPNHSSIGSMLNKLASAGTGSSSSSSSPGSSPNLSSIGSMLNKLASAGTGSSSSSSSPGSLNKPGSTGGAYPSFGSAASNPSLSSGGTSVNKQVPTTRGLPTTGSASGSVGPNPNLSSSGVGSNKPTSNVKSSTGFGSSYGSTGSTSRTGSASSALSLFGFGSSNSGQSKTGSGTSHGGTGSSFGAGKTNEVAGGSTSVAQHLQELQRIINPPGPEEKQDLSRMLG